MLKLVDRCDNLLFLGVENSANMWRKRKEALFNAANVAKKNNLPKVSRCFSQFFMTRTRATWVVVPNLIQFDVEFSYGLKFSS